MDATRIILQPEAFDAVVSFEVFEHLRDPVGYLESISQVLKSLGMFFLSTPNRRYYSPGDKVEDQPLSREGVLS